MKYRVVSLLFLIPLLAACQIDMVFPHGRSSNDSNNSSGDIVIGDFKITNVEYLSSFQNNIRVSYSGSINPFNVENHEFDRLEINESRSNWVSPNHSQHYFEAYAPKRSLEEFLFDFYDVEENLYISVTYKIGGSDTSSSVSSSEDSSSSSETETIVYPDGYSTLIFNDEFDGSSVNENNWDYDIGTGTWGWGNGEMEYYRKENATVSNGTLHITAKKEDYKDSHFTSSRMVTRGKFSFKYGYVEAKIKLPVEQAMWPAFWMLPEDNVYGGWPFSGEIDIMEAKGRIPTQSSSALHYATLEGNHTYQSHEVNGHNIANYHIYACEWKQTAINFYVDGALHLTVRNDVWTTSAAPSNVNAPFDQNFHIILNLAVGGQFDGWVEPREDFTSADMVVDYVRVFQ